MELEWLSMQEGLHQSNVQFQCFNIYIKYILQYKIHVHIYINLSEKKNNAQDIKPCQWTEGAGSKSFTGEETTSTPNRKQ